MVPGVAQTVPNLGPPACLRVGGPAAACDFPGDVQVDEQVGLRDTPPHRGYVGVFLRYLAGVVPSLAQRAHEQRFARGAGANDGDERAFFLFGPFHRRSGSLKTW